MSEQQQNERLNEVLVRILRGLLQYTGECWPWSSAANGDEHVAVMRLVDEQQEQIRELSELLNERGALIDFGTYPTEYTDLNYVSLDYMLDELIREQQALIADLKQAITDCASDPEGQELLTEIEPQV